MTLASSYPRVAAGSGKRTSPQSPGRPPPAFQMLQPKSTVHVPARCRLLQEASLGLLQAGGDHCSPGAPPSLWAGRLGPGPGAPDATDTRVLASAGAACAGVQSPVWSPQRTQPPKGSRPGSAEAGGGPSITGMDSICVSTRPGLPALRIRAVKWSLRLSQTG